MLSTKKFVAIIAIALLVFVVVVGSVAFAVAESKNTYEVDAVVVNMQPFPWGDYEVQVVDEENNLWGYYADADEDVCVGDVVTLTIFNFGTEEESEVVDVT